jgi:hypothetical protein
MIRTGKEIDMFRPLVSTIALSCFALFVMVSGARGGSVNWAQFAQSPGGLAAIATGIATLGSCETPYEFSQDNDEDKIFVSVNCNEDDGESSVIIQFEHIGPHLIARRIDLAG